MDRFPSWLLRMVIPIVNRWGWASKKVNALAIGGLVGSTRERPHPWSTVHDYISWTSLTDQRYSARHLPAVPADPDLPSPDSLSEMFARPPGAPQRLSDKSTVLFPAFAQYLTDGFIRTRMPHEGEPELLRLQNTSNHQIDMCPLYGRTPAQTAALRTRSEESGARGRLRSQRIGDEEFPPFLLRDDGSVDPDFAVLDAPLGLDDDDPAERRARIFAVGGDRVNAVPQVAMMNTLFLREHNRLAGEVEALHPTWDDERVFETTRNAVIVTFIKVVVEEYINHISPSPFRFLAEPSVAWDATWNKPNWMTTEFSLLYRWHSLVPDTIRWGDTTTPVHETFMDNGPLLDRGLVGAFVDMSAQRAGQLGSFNTTPSLVPLEEAAIAQGRLARLAPFADYCVHVGKARPRSFDDISSDPAVVDFLADRYRGVDDVDFYVGLFAEDLVENSPLPSVLTTMVGVDAFSQALTNPLLSRHVMADPVAAFSRPGAAAFSDTGSLADIVERNSPSGTSSGRTAFIGMTQPTWRHRW